MPLLFGWYTFLIKAYTLSELGIPTEGILENVQIEIRQRCFHLFWIPFFRVGKVYACRRADRKLYNLPPELEGYLRANIRPKTPWYAYIGLILVAVGFLIYTANEKYNDYETKKHIEELHKTKREIMTNPMVTDRYAIYTDKFHNNFFLEVMKTKPDSAFVNIKIRVRKGDKPYSYGTFPDTEDFVIASQWIANQDMLKAAVIENYSCQDSLQLYIHDLGGITFFALKEMWRYNKEYW